MLCQRHHVSPPSPSGLQAGAMSHGQGYVGNAADSARIRRLTEQREKEKADFELRGSAVGSEAPRPAGYLYTHSRAQALKASRESRNGTRLLGFAASNLEYVEHVFKQDTVGLQTKEQFVEKVREEGQGARQVARQRGAGSGCVLCTVVRPAPSPRSPARECGARGGGAAAACRQAAGGGAAAGAGQEARGCKGDSHREAVLRGRGRGGGGRRGSRRRSAICC